MRTHVSPLLSAVASILGVIIFVLSILLEHSYYRWVLIGMIAVIVGLKMLF